MNQVSRHVHERGQFIPIALILIFTAFIFLYAVANIYLVSRAKLQAQNLADAVATAVAALEAKSINTVVDRDEWMNHLYPDSILNSGDPTGGCDRLPPISMAGTGIWKNCYMGDDSPTGEAHNYAQLVATINQAQRMFQSAYNNFMGSAGGSGAALPGQNSGAGGLIDILREIDGLNNPDVRVIIYNNSAGEQDAQSQANQMIHNGANEFGNLTNAYNNIRPTQMANVPFQTEEVNVPLSKNKTETLSALLKLPPKSVGWMRPDWENTDPTSAGLDVKGPNGATQHQIGAGAIVIKHVGLKLIRGVYKDIYVQAKSTAYVMKTSGLSVGAAPGQPPVHFKPTYYIQLGSQ